ncbi:hypothetical protein [Bradyrhizobium sp. Tv2a-2]|uniref:hypothetical protein n=1 Tax=Bradyrhizobium sp. Tv2a-2 TaxID=113395 RepID=UPI00040CDAD9|nr:hypothetical protein [Bradyrhizobium sp. Tv2a-2]
MPKPKTVAVSQGRVPGYGPNTTEAKADLKHRIDYWCGAGDPHMEIRFGYVLIAFQMPSGDVAYRTIGPDLINGEHGKHLYPTCVMNGTLAQAIAEARYSVAQNAWNRAGSDEDHIAKSGLKAERADELRHWIKWQRSYDEHIAAGKTKDEAFQMASGY